MLIIQDPTDVDSTFLLQTLLDGLKNATGLFGAFAFASSAGARLIFEDQAFKSFAGVNDVDLVVGIDAVTNTRAIETLEFVQSRYSRVRIRAFLNPRPEKLFHPKYCWMKNSSGGLLVTGSGNLTEGGLLGNWEAYTVEQTDEREAGRVERLWMDWTTKHSRNLLSLSDSKVKAMVSQNNVLAREGDLPVLMAAGPRNPELPFDESTNALIAEIPKSGDRWKQANFDLDNYRNFFGADDTGRLVVFRHVKHDGTMDEYERNRPPVTVKSRNFRFELAAAGGLDYPDNGRPIGVFVRAATRTFFYRLLLPEDLDYRTVEQILTTKMGAAATNMRRLRMTVKELHQDWPNSPFWKLPPLV